MVSLEEATVGFMGAGNMAQAIGFSILSKGILKPKQMFVSAPSDRNLKEWRDKGCKTFHNNGDLLAACDFIFLATKPQYFEKAISEFRSDAFVGPKEKCFVSIMAGIPVSSIQLAIAKHVQTKEMEININSINVIRAMPNTPMMIGCGATAIADSPHKEMLKMVETLLCAGGSCEIMDEKIMNAVGAVSGCGPAFMYMVIEALADGGVKVGVPRDIALRMAANTMVGSAKMVLTGEHPGSLKDKVCSAGGSTIAGVHALEKAAVRGAFISAVEAASLRSKELGSS